MRAATLALTLAASLAGLSPAWAAMRLALLDQNGLTATLTAEPDALSRESPLVATLTIDTPAHLTPALPALTERFRGFTVVEDFPAGRVEANGRARATWRLRLTPGPEGPWRLMPLPLTLKDARTGQSSQALTRAITFPEPPPLPEAAGSPECAVTPVWVAPGWRTYGLWALLAAAAATLLLALRPLLRRARRALHERALSPEARARLELDRLLAENLLAQGHVKRFYYGLTGIVRRYFERAHALRATRQTTQEFLATLTARPDIPASVKTALATVLDAADRVKFAGVAATPAEAQSATDATRTLIATDAAQQPRPSPAGDPDSPPGHPGV